MDISNLLESAKNQLDSIKAQLASINVPQTLKKELLENQDALQRAYDSLLSHAGVINEQTKQELTDALSSAKKSSLAATAAANNRTLLWVGVSIISIIGFAILVNKLYEKHSGK